MDKYAIATISGEKTASGEKIGQCRVCQSPVYCIEGKRQMTCEHCPCETCLDASVEKAARIKKAKQR